MDELELFYFDDKTIEVLQKYRDILTQYKQVLFSPPILQEEGIDDTVIKNRIDSAIDKINKLLSEYTRPVT